MQEQQVGGPDWADVQRRRVARVVNVAIAAAVAIGMLMWVRA